MELIEYTAYISSLYIIIGLSCFIGLKATGFINFFYGVMLVLAFYFTYFFHTVLRLNSFSSIALSLLCCFLVGLCYSKLMDNRYEKGDHLQTRNLLISLGLYIIVQNVISLCFGDDTKILYTFEASNDIVLRNGVHILPVYLWAISVALLIVVIYASILKYTKVGLIFQAISNNRTLSEMIGLKTTSIIAFFVALSYCTIGTAGIIIGSDTGISPTIGLQSMMMGIVAVIIGGRKKVLGVIVGALVISVLQVSSSLYLSNEWKELNTFVLLLVFLIFKPNGLICKTKG